VEAGRWEDGRMRAARMAILLLGLAWALIAPAAGADKYPSRPVRLIAGFPAGGAVDITARVMADWFSADLGQQFVVENRGGSGHPVRRPQQRDQHVALQETAVRFHPRHRAGRRGHAADQHQQAWRGH
jgi:hypothetical protein